MSKYTAEDIQYLKDNYPSGDLDLICKHLGRTMNGIRLKASRLGLARSWGEDYTLMRCFGKDFDASCMIRCVGHEACLNKYLELIKVDGSIILSQNRLTIVDKVKRDQLMRALKVLKEVQE